MKVLIITEAGSDIGLGHLIRCRALSEAFEERGCEVRTILSSGDFSTENNNIGKFNIPARPDRQEDIISSIGEDDVVVIDSYLLDEEFYQKVHETAVLLISIDDFARIRYPGGLVLNGLITADRSDYETETGVEYLLGPDYALLRRCFWTPSSRSVHELADNVLITLGGSSAGNDFMKNAVKMITAEQGFSVHVVTNYPEALGSIDTNKVKVSKGLDESGMMRAMENCDICISGGGTTIYELAVTGTPAIGVCFAENQYRHLREWSETGFIKDIGWFNSPEVLSKLTSAMAELSSLAEREKMSDLGKERVDGNGAKRVAEEIIKRQGGC